MPKKGERIYKRNDGRWEGRYRSGINRDGKSVYRSVYGKSYYEVKKKLSACNESSEPIELSSKKSPLFKDVIVLWQKANQNRYKGATALKYGNLIDSHILPSLGGYRLSEINTFVLADFMDNKLNTGRLDRAGGLSPSYVRSIMLIVFEVIDFAVKEDMCEPLRTQIHKPVIEKSELEILDVCSQAYLERQLFLCPSETGVGILISLNTGLRISEVCALRWSDIDFEKAILCVRSTVARVKSTENDKTTVLIIRHMRYVSLSSEWSNDIKKDFESRK